ncbi:MAG: hypothetical protein ACTS45_01295 [Candidatus Hodgkinia cicadicola]
MKTNKTLSLCKTLSKIGKAEHGGYLSLGKLVNGRVIAKVDEYALFDVGFVKNAIMLNNGSWEFNHLSVGDWRKVYIEENDKTKDYIIVSRRHLAESERWNLMEHLCENGGEVKATIVKLTRRGIRMDVYGLIGVIFWTKGLLALENELRNMFSLMVRVRAICKRYNTIILTPSRAIEDTIRRKLSNIVWTSVLDLCDLGLWTSVDACNGIITLSGRPWCFALGVINQLTLGKLIVSNFVKISKGERPVQSRDCVDLIVNFMIEIDKTLEWERNVLSIDDVCVWSWVTSLTQNTREHWCEWKRLGIKQNVIRHFGGSLMSPPKVMNFELNKEIVETSEKQNIMWNKEQVKLAELLCGFEFKRFDLTKLTLGKVRNGQLRTEDKDWLRKVGNAWLDEIGKLVSFKTKCQTELPKGDWKRIIGSLKTGNGSCNWREELDYAINRKLKDGKLIDRIYIQAKVERGTQIEGGVKMYKRDDLRRNCDKRSNGSALNDKGEDLPTIVEMELDGEWEREWKALREPNYWWEHYTETDCSLIETSYGNWPNVKSLRSVYAVIVGMDIQTTMLMVAMTTTLLAYVCDFSIETEDVTMLTNDWGNDLAFKVAPIGLNFGIDDAMVEIDISGYKYLRFVNENWDQSLIGIVAKVGTTDATIELAVGIYGTLRFELPTDCFGIKVGMEVDVVLTDWNVITNDVNLRTNEREEVNTILMERRREV